MLGDQVPEFHSILSTAFRRKNLKIRDLDAGSTLGKSDPDTGHSWSKGPEAGVCLLSLRKRQEVGGVGVK